MFSTRSLDPIGAVEYGCNSSKEKGTLDDYVRWRTNAII